MVTALAIAILVLAAAYGALIYRLTLALGDVWEYVEEVEEVDNAWSDLAVERFEALKAVVLLQNHALVSVADKVFPKDKKVENA